MLPSDLANLDLEGVAGGTDLMLAGTIDAILAGFADYAAAGVTDLRIALFAGTEQERLATRALADALAQGAI